jgi:putative ABC transport system permease protein
VKADAGAWHYILLRTKDGVDPAAVIKGLNADFKARNMDLVALDWEGAAGVVASFVVAAQTFFLILVIIISIVSVIVIMNTMVVSIIERTAEIGTMRALGANKSYIRKIFMTETFTLSVVGGLIGLALAGILLFVLNRTGLPAPHSLFEIIFGGKIMHPVLSWVSAAQALEIMRLGGIVSSLYPTMVALRIQPVKAMQSN